MLKDALIGVGIGMLGGMILVKCCPKADKLADEVKSKIANVSNQKESGGCGCDFESGSDCSCGDNCDCSNDACNSNYYEGGR